MTTPTTQPDRITASEIRELFKNLHINTAAHIEELRDELKQQAVEINGLIAELHAMRGGLQQAATAPAQVGTTEAVTMTRITRTRTNGKWYYKMQGGRYMKRGVTVWDEVLSDLAIDTLSIPWDAQDGYTFPQPLTVAVLLKEYTDDGGEIKTTPQKVIGKG